MLFKHDSRAGRCSGGVNVFLLWCGSTRNEFDMFERDLGFAIIAIGDEQNSKYPAYEMIPQVNVDCSKSEPRT